MASNAVTGAKRPLEANAPAARKRPAADGDDDLIDEAFEMEPPDEDVDELGPEEEVEEGALGEAGKNWQRPPPPRLDPSKDSLLFQQLEVDFSSGPPNKAYYKTDLREAPVLRMYGVNKLGARPPAGRRRRRPQIARAAGAACSLLPTNGDSPLCSPLACAGNSCCVFIHGFEPYFYVEAPPTFSPDDCAPLTDTLNVRARPAHAGLGTDGVPPAAAQC
jgi:DNA polymerase delta subunit 1